MSQPDLTVRFPQLCYLGHLWAMTLPRLGCRTKPPEFILAAGRSYGNTNDDSCANYQPKIQSTYIVPCLPAYRVYSRADGEP